MTETVVKKLIDFNGSVAVLLPKSWVDDASISTHVQLRYDSVTKVIEVIRRD